MSSNTGLGPKNSKSYHLGDSIWSAAANKIKPDRGYKTKSVWPWQEKERFLDSKDIEYIGKSCIISMRRLKKGNPDYPDDELLSSAAREVHIYLTGEAPTIGLREKHIPDSEYIEYITRLCIKELKNLDKEWAFNSGQQLADTHHSNYYE